MLFYTRGAVVALVLLSFLAGCEETIRSKVVVSFPPNFEQQCLGGERFEFLGQPIDTYVVDVFELVGSPDLIDNRRSACWRCAVEGEEGRECRWLSRQCLCGGDRRTARQADRGIEGLRFEELPEATQLCLRVTMFDRVAGPEGGTSDAPTECDSSLDVCSLPGSELPSDVHGCMMSELFTLGREDEVVPIREVVCSYHDAILDACEAGQVMCRPPQSALFPQRCLVDGGRGSTQDLACGLDGSVCSEAMGLCFAIGNAPVRLSECAAF